MRNNSISQNYSMVPTQKSPIFTLFSHLEVRLITLSESKHSECTSGMKHHDFGIFFLVQTELSCKIPSRQSIYWIYEDTGRLCYSSTLFNFAF